MSQCDGALRARGHTAARGPAAGVGPSKTAKRRVGEPSRRFVGDTVSHALNVEHPVTSGYRLRTCQVELRDSESRSAPARLLALQPFPRVRLTAGGLPGQLGPRPHRRVFPRGQQSFPLSAFFRAVTLRFCCRAAVGRPRAPLLVTVTLGYLEIRRRERTARWRFLVCPRLASLRQLGLHAKLHDYVESIQPRGSPRCRRALAAQPGQQQQCCARVGPETKTAMRPTQGAHRGGRGATGCRGTEGQYSSAM
jgi:hypothetical protein